MEMNRNTCNVYKNEYNPLYYSTDSTKAALPVMIIRSEYELVLNEYETLDYIEKYVETKYIN